MVERAREIARYIRWLKSVEHQMQSDLLATMRASAYLLIYNLVESSARGLSDLIVDALKSGQHSFVDLSAPLRKEFLRHAQKKGSQYALMEGIEDKTVDFTSHYDPSEIFSGNVDTKRIRERLSDLGCATIDFGRELQIPTQHLLTLKGIRNDLAHGVKSFNDVGKASTASDLEQVFVVALRTLRRAFSEVEGLISRRQYLSLPVPQAGGLVHSSNAQPIASPSGGGTALPISLEIRRGCAFSWWPWNL